MTTNKAPLKDEVNLRVRLRGDDAEYLAQMAAESERSVAAELRLAAKQRITEHKLRRAGRKV